MWDPRGACAINRTKTSLDWSHRDFRGQLAPGQPPRRVWRQVAQDTAEPPAQAAGQGTGRARLLRGGLLGGGGSSAARGLAVGSSSARWREGLCSRIGRGAGAVAGGWHGGAGQGAGRWGVQAAEGGCLARARPAGSPGRGLGSGSSRLPECPPRRSHGCCRTQSWTSRGKGLGVPGGRGHCRLWWAKLVWTPRPPVGSGSGRGQLSLCRGALLTVAEPCPLGCRGSSCGSHPQTHRTPGTRVLRLSWDWGCPGARVGSSLWKGEQLGAVSKGPLATGGRTPQAGSGHVTVPQAPHAPVPRWGPGGLPQPGPAPLVTTMRCGQPGLSDRRSGLDAT